jgi:uncharacterized protein YkwD
MRTELLAFSLVIAACGGGGGSDIDADPNAPDADPNAPDADPSRPDARVHPDAPGSVDEPPELAGITLAHNQVRASVDTTPGIPPLTWNASLAATAQAWSAQCMDTDGNGLIDHNPNRSDGHPYYVGENIYGGSGMPTGPDAVDLWVSEAANYDYATNSCSGVCGHYTQVVWRNTAELGCALYDCPSLTYRYSIVCDYGPGGNDGGLPY